MAATIHIPTRQIPSQRCPADSPTSVGRPAAAAVYHRRRLAVGVVLVMVGALLWTMATWAANSAVGIDPVGANRSQTAVAVHVVQPGDTLWSIASEIDPNGDVRDTVDRLADLNGGSALSVGQRLVLGS